MAYVKTIIYHNEGANTPEEIYRCDRCSNEISEAHPHYYDGENNYHLCWECGFIEGVISEKQFLTHCGVYLCKVRAAYHEGEIVYWTSKNPPWDKRNKKLRNTKQYFEWRDAVFRRDNYTCLVCNIRGGRLEAHHIKRFEQYPSLRHDIDNGETLCIKCHRMKHRKVG